MDLTKILSVAGKPGLHKHVAQSKNGVIIESLTDQSRTKAFMSQQVNSLQDIAIFTTGEDISLTDVFQAIYKEEDGGKCISHKSSSKEITTYFEKVLPEYDKERVYISNIKRVLQWYNILQDNKLIDLEKPEEDKDTEENTTKVENSEIKNTETKTEKEDISDEKEEK